MRTLLKLPNVVAGAEGSWPAKRAAAAVVAVGTKLVVFGGHAHWELNEQTLLLSYYGASCGVDCRPANGSLSARNIRRIFRGIFEMPCTEWYTSVDSRRLSTVELKLKAFLAVDSGACYGG
eukprot:1177219-Prorocentrum_minimum.AAC.5